MIKVALKNHRHFYDTLKYGYVGDDEDFFPDENKTTLTKHNQVNGIGSFDVELPEPLRLLSYYFQKLGTFYNIVSIISARDKAIFQDFSRIYASMIERKGGRFIATTPNGTGHILNNGLEVLLTVTCEKDNPKIRKICLGECGSKSRIFGDFKDFISDTNLLEKYVNLFIEVCYVRTASKKRGEIIPDITLEVN